MGAEVRSASWRFLPPDALQEHIHHSLEDSVARSYLASVAVALLACTTASAQDSLEADRAAVLAAMDFGSNAIRNRDWAAYSQFWANSPDIEVIHPAAREWLIGWDTVAVKYRAVISDTSIKYSFATIRRNAHVSPSRDMAWGTDETRITITQGTRTTEILQWSTFVFERRDGTWRLVHAHASVPPAPRPATRPQGGG